MSTIDKMSTNDKYLIVAILIAAVVIIAMMYNRRETFNAHSMTADQYYSYRTFDPKPNDYKRMTSFPYTYHPYEYPQPFNCYGSHDVIYGYGVW